MMKPDATQTVAEIVTADYRTADIFRKYGINYCCGGKISLSQALLAGNINPESFMYELQQATRTVKMSNALEVDQWEIDFLADYITNVHHAYLYKVLPQLETQLISFVNSHVKQYPELAQIHQTFSELLALLIPHNQYEEKVIFPYIRHMSHTIRRREVYGSLFVRTLGKSLSSIVDEHEPISALLLRLQTLSGNYGLNEKACTNHRVIFQKLEELHNDLVQHKHLENNILYPRAIAMEKTLLQQ